MIQKELDELHHEALVLLGAHQLNGDIARLHRAITLLGRLVAVEPSDHPDRSTHLSLLGGALWLDYERTGNTGRLRWPSTSAAGRWHRRPPTAETACPIWG